MESEGVRSSWAASSEERASGNGNSMGKWAFDREG